jgi:hypothetical protein
MSSSLILKLVDKSAGAKDVPRCRFKEFNGSGYRRRTIMDNNDQTVTKLDRNWSKWQVSPSGRYCPTTSHQYASHVPVFSGRDTKEEKLVVSTFENSQSAN